MKVNCPHCGQKYDVEERHCGLECECQNCEKTFIVPVLPAESPAAVGAAVEATKLCPFCAEPIQADARKCKHCGEFLNRSSGKTTAKYVIPIVIVCVVLLLALGGVIIWLVSRPAPPTSDEIAGALLRRQQEQGFENLLAREKNRCVNQLKELALLIFMYTTDYNRMPEKLDDLIKEGYARSLVKSCPGAPEYIYLRYNGPLESIINPSAVPLMICPVHISVARADGSIYPTAIKSIHHYTANEAIDILDPIYEFSADLKQQIKKNWN